jgi:hypothetical protein
MAAINSKRGQKSGHEGTQLGLWDQLVIDPGPALKAAMNEAIKGCSLSREEIVEEMNRLAGMAGISTNGKSQKVTPSLLDKWVAPGAVAYMIPIRLLHIFCRVVGSNLPLEVYSACFPRVKVIGEDDYKLLQWARKEVESRKARREARRMAHEVGIE